MDSFAGVFARVDSRRNSNPVVYVRTVTFIDVPDHELVAGNPLCSVEPVSHLVLDVSGQFLDPTCK